MKWIKIDHFLHGSIASSVEIIVIWGFCWISRDPQFTSFTSLASATVGQGWCIYTESVLDIILYIYDIYVYNLDTYMLKHSVFHTFLQIKSRNMELRSLICIKVNIAMENGP